MSSRREMLAFLSLSRLPTEFQEVEYLESTRTQYIDTGFANQSSNQKIICDYIAKTNAGSLFGSQQGSNRSGIYWQSYPNNLQFGIGSQTASSVIGSIAINERQLIEYTSTSNTYSVKVDSTYLKENASYSGSNITGINIYLFCNNYQNTTENLQNGFKLYSCQIYDNNTLVRDFVPCYRKADNVAGLYDLVNGVFYTNAGTGDFIVGGNV